jgi:anti-sigma B factor antagonist
MNRVLNLQCDDSQQLVIVQASGFLAQLEVYKLKNQVDAIMHKGHRFFILDLSQVRFIDSAGIGVIVHLHTTCMQKEGRLFVINSTSAPVRQALRTATISDVLETFDDLESAKTSVVKRFGLRTDNTSKLDQENELLRQMMQVVDRLSQIERRISRIEHLMSHQNTPTMN